MDAGICYVAFSGGLDSTWIMYTLLRDGHRVVPLHTNVGAPVGQMVAETLIRREILKVFHKLFPGQIVDELSIRRVTHQFSQEGPVKPGTERQTLYQQLMVRDALLNCVSLGNPTTDRYFVGWHKDDTEGTFSAEHYAFLCNLTPYFQITEARGLQYGWFSPDTKVEIEVPCWEKDKKEMWDELPVEINKLVVVDYCNFEIYDRHQEIGIKVVGSKREEYVALGVDVSKDFLVPFPEYDMDKLFIYESCSSLDGEVTKAIESIYPVLVHCHIGVKNIKQVTKWPFGEFHEWISRWAHMLSAQKNFVQSYPYL